MLIVILGFPLLLQECPTRKSKDCEGYHSSSPSTSCSMSPSNKRRGKRKQWTDPQMVSTLDTVLTKQLPAKKTARMYRVPLSTPKDRLSGRVIHGVKPGPTPYLASQEEKYLADHLILSGMVGYGKTRRDVMNLVETYINSQRYKQPNHKEVTVSNE